MGVRPRILIGGSALFSNGGDIPRPLAKAGVALERLRALGEPVVLVGAELGGRLLPDDEDERVAWVRTCLDAPGLPIVPFEEATASRPTDPAADQAVERWSGLQTAWGAEVLITTAEECVGPARRAGLAVVRVGARGPAADPTQPRADYEAFDLLDAVRHLLVAHTFDEPAGDSDGLQPVASLRRGGPASAADADVLQRGEPGGG